MLWTMAASICCACSRKSRCLRCSCVKNGSQCFNCVLLRLKRCCNAAAADDDWRSMASHHSCISLLVSFPRPPFCPPRQASMLFPRMRAMTRPIPFPASFPVVLPPVIAVCRYLRPFTRMRICRICLLRSLALIPSLIHPALPLLPPLPLLLPLPLPLLFPPLLLPLLLLLHLLRLKAQCLN